jgi:predicted secreted Zn-dependent protease
MSSGGRGTGISLLGRRLGAAVSVVVAVSLVVAACQATVSPTGVPDAVVTGPSPSPAPVARPGQTANLCEQPLRELANASQLMADKLVSLREPLLASSYDGWRILGLARSANATLKLYALAIPGLDPCPEAAELAERLALVSSSARRQITIVLKEGTAAKPAPRQAMVGLFELLPEVVSISKDATALADRYSIQLTAATVPEGSMEPLGELAPLPKPEATPRDPTTAGIEAEFFGPGVTLETFRVSGTTPFEISMSMNENGPYSEWTQSRVDGLTEARVSYRFQLASGASGSCFINATANPPILIRYTVTLPRWTSPSSASAATVEWWNSLVLEIATHERVHISIYRDAQRDLNQALGSSNCDNAESRLSAVWNDANREQCEFDMKEYGYALGLSLEDCVTQ